MLKYKKTKTKRNFLKFPLNIISAMDKNCKHDLVEISLSYLHFVTV